MNSIIIFSVILWVFIDRAKKMWANVSWGNWITTCIATACGLLLAFGYGLDLLSALGVCEFQTIGGHIFAGLAIAGGSSVVNELLEKINKE